MSLCDGPGELSCMGDVGASRQLLRVPCPSQFEVDERRVLEPVIPGDDPRRPLLAALRAGLERHWCAATSFWPEKWTEDRASLGQCAVTSMIVYDRFGGEILRTVNQGVLHYWNRLEGLDVDVTRDQFDWWAPED